MLVYLCSFYNTAVSVCSLTYYFNMVVINRNENNGLSSEPPFTLLQ